MGYFDGLTAAAFKQDAQGRDLFYLWGKFGKGRVVPTEDDGASVRQYLKNYYLCVIFGIVPVVVISGEALQPRWFATIGVFALLVLAAFIPLWLRTRQWEVSDERMTYRESMSASAHAHGAGSLWLLVVLSGLFVAGGLFLLFKSDSILIGALMVLFFGACLGVFIWMLIARWRG